MPQTWFSSPLGWLARVEGNTSGFAIPSLRLCNLAVATAATPASAAAITPLEFFPGNHRHASSVKAMITMQEAKRHASDGKRVTVG